MLRIPRSQWPDCSFSLPPLRSDKTLQDIVYKLVPGLFKSKSTAAAISVATCVYFHSDSAFISSAVSS